MKIQVNLFQRAVGSDPLLYAWPTGDFDDINQVRDIAIASAQRNYADIEMVEFHSEDWTQRELWVRATGEWVREGPAPVSF
jgi:hypothetical protein